MHEAAERAARGAVLERQLHLDQPEARAMGVDRHRGLHPESSREWHDSRNHRGLEGAPAETPGGWGAGGPEIGAAGSSPVVRLIAQREKPSAAPKPPPRRRAKEATARSPSSRSSASTRRGRSRAEAPRSPSHSTTVGVSPASSSRRTASVLAPPFPRRLG